MDKDKDKNSYYWAPVKKKTKEEILKEMSPEVLADCGDEERQHERLDGLLLEYIGDEDIARAFYKIDKWYA